MPTPTTVGASDVATDAIQASVQRTFQRKAFFALGRHWVFYVNDGGFLVYDSSIGDSEAWYGPAVLANQSNGREFTVFIQQASPTTAYVHLVRADVTGATPVYYHRGTLNSNGTISWASEDEAVPLALGYEYENLGITMGWDGRIYIVYNKVEAADPTNTTPYVCMSTTSDGTWTTGTGYPLQITAVQDGSWIPLISPYWQEVIVVYTSIGGSIYSRVLSGGVWGAQVDTGVDIGPDSTKISIVPETRVMGLNGSSGKVASSVYVAYQADDWDLYCIRYESGAWGAENVIEVIGAFREASPMLSILDTGDSDGDHMPGTLYCFWTPTADAPTAEWVTYRLSRDFGETWTDESGEDMAEEWIDETMDGFEVQASGSAYSFSGSDYANAEFYIGLVYVVHRMPPCLRHAALGFADPYENLLGKFVIRHETSINLASEFIVRHEASVDLFGEFIAQYSAAVELFGIFDVRQEPSVSLLGEFLVRQETSVDLAASFGGQTFVDLLGELVARRESAVDLLGEFIVRHETSVNLHGEFNARYAADIDLEGEFIVRRSATRDLFGIFYVNQDAVDLYGMFLVKQSDEDLLGEFLVRQETSVELLGIFDIRGEQDENLLGIFNVRQETEVELLGIFAVRHVGIPRNLLGEFVVRHVGTPVELPAEVIVRNVAAANLLGEFIVRHSAAVELFAIFIVRHETAVDLFAQFRLDKDYISKGLNVSVYRDLLVIG